MTSILPPSYRVRNGYSIPLSPHGAAVLLINNNGKRITLILFTFSPMFLHIFFLLVVLFSFGPFIIIQNQKVFLFPPCPAMLEASKHEREEKRRLKLGDICKTRNILYVT